MSLEDATANLVSPMRKEKSVEGLSSFEDVTATDGRLAGDEWANVRVGKLLGKGSFCEVFVVEGSSTPTVFKMPRRDFASDTSKRKMAQRDLEREALLLEAIRPHVHIIRLLRVQRRASRVEYIALARASEVFPVRYQRWIEQRDSFQFSSFVSPFGTPMLCCFTACARGLRGLLQERLGAAHQLASALDHLHTAAVPGHAVAYRDLKPANLGFDAADRLILFDFGLAKLVPLVATDRADLEMSAETGSPRYMAPEVILDKTYDERCDTYSFGVFLWQCATLELPYAGYNPATYREKVAIGGARLRLQPDWPVELRSLISACWRRNPANRPACAAVVHRLDDILQILAEPPS